MTRPYGRLRARSLGRHPSLGVTAPKALSPDDPGPSADQAGYPPPRRQARAASPAARARYASSASGSPALPYSLPRPEPLRLRRQRIEHAAGQEAAPARLVLPFLHDFPDPGRFHRFPCSSPPPRTPSHVSDLRIYVSKPRSARKTAGHRRAGSSPCRTQTLRTCHTSACRLARRRRRLHRPRPR